MKYIYVPYGIEIDPYAANKTKLLVEAIKKAIENELLHLGDRLLSHHELSKSLNLGINIIRSAYKELEDQRYLTAVGRGGTKVSWDFKYFDQNLEPKFTLGSDVQRAPVRTIKSLKGSQMDYLQIGLDGLNPALILQNKPSTALNIIYEELQRGSNSWMGYKQQEREFKKVVQRKLVRDLSASFSLKEIALGGNRMTVLVNLIKIVFRKGQTVVLSSHADRELKELLDLHGLHLIFISSSTNGMNLTELKAVLDCQCSLKDPVICIYSNPYHDSFSNLNDIDVRREALYNAAQEWSVMLIEEYGQSEYIIPLVRVKWANEGEPIQYTDVILIAPLSNLFPGMNEVNMVIAPEGIIADFQSRAIGSSNIFIDGFEIYTRVIDEAVLEKQRNEIITKLDHWQTELKAAAQHYLSPWFELKEGSCGTSFWMVAKNMNTIRLPLKLMRKEPLAFRHSACQDGELVSVQAFRICLGYGDLKSFDNVFGIMNEYLTRNRPVFAISSSSGN